MKKAIFILLVALTFQGSAQVKEGYYKSTHSVYIDYNSNGKATKDVTYMDTTFLHITENGFRVIYELHNWGVYYPWMFIKKAIDGNYLYTVHRENACKINTEMGYFLYYYDFNEVTGFYDKGINYINLEYLHE
tara:strand:+ start:703 stop:1101 length:399 start_codon:yes stop_codon:yes gene_type:complete